MQYIAIAIVSVGAVELLLRLPIVDLSKRMAQLTQRALHIVSMKSASDHRKERVLPVYSARLARCTVELAGCLILLGLAVWLGLVAMDWFLSPEKDSVHVIATWQGLAASLLGAFAYVPLRGYFG